MRFMVLQLRRLNPPRGTIVCLTEDDILVHRNIVRWIVSAAPQLERQYEHVGLKFKPKGDLMQVGAADIRVPWTNPRGHVAAGQAETAWR